MAGGRVELVRDPAQPMTPAPLPGLCSNCYEPTCAACDRCAACEGHREDCKYAVPVRNFYRPPKRIRTGYTEAE